MTQISLFDGDTQLKITKPIRLIELFAGYGSQSLALKYLKVSFEHWKICEWAVKSIQAYKDLHFGDDTCDYSKAYSVDELIEMLLAKGISADYNSPMTREQIKRMGEQKIRTVYNNIIATNNLVSVCNAHAQDFEIQDTDNYTYIMTYSFPCQDLSKAGNGAGMAKGSGTRSGMLWEVERILDECNGNLPQILLMENVPDVIGSNSIKHFAQWVKKLEQLGYTSKWQCLNAKDYGVPQNRDRCFMVSWLGNHYYDFPSAVKLEKRLIGILETNVEEKYYLSGKILESYAESNRKNNGKGNGFRFELVDGRGGIEDMNPIEKEILAVDGFNQSIRADQTCFGTITRNAGADLKRNGQGVIEIVSRPHGSNNGGVVKSDTFPTVRKSATMDGNTGIVEPVIGAFRGRNPDNPSDRTPGAPTEQRLEINSRNLSNTLTTVQKDNVVVEPLKNQLRIRKLTPKECGRLMGVHDDDIDKMSVNQSSASLYHLFGDSIVVDVLMAIFKQML